MLLRRALVATLDPLVVETVDLRVEGDTIVERRPGLQGRAGEEVIDFDGALILPGLVNAHTHLYSALARGMPGPAVPPRNFVEILERVWWRLDRALDEESVYASGLAGALEAAWSGTTLLIDHHSSPSFIRGSLKTLQRAIEAVGLRSVLCYETTDRNGTEGRDLGIEENVAFQIEQGSTLTRGMVGAHASFTLEDASLDALASAAARLGSGVHIHVAEDHADVEDCRNRHGCSLPERLARHHLLSHRSLLAHCVHLRPDEIAQAERSGCWIAHNPRSNMNNSVGYAPVASMNRAALGTDGMDEDMLVEARAAYLKMREAGRDKAMTAALSLLAGGHRLAGELLGIRLGELGEGAPADLVILDYDPPTPVSSENLAGHLLFGVDRSHVSSVMVGGRWIVRDRRLQTVDPTKVMARARAASAVLWDRMARLPEAPRSG
jgi:putative selenium metabolism protein SsnA